ncbi:hypothetical protein H0H93_007106 [Arthromyces matolae]|nr:hypothetical protein H0H93_007106 [Arthromyces matolae]
MWKKESAEVRKHFARLAEREKEEHQMRYPDYQYRPRKREQKELEAKEAKEYKRSLKDKGRKERKGELVGMPQIPDVQRSNPIPVNLVPAGSSNFSYQVEDTTVNVNHSFSIPAPFVSESALNVPTPMITNPPFDGYMNQNDTLIPDVQVSLPTTPVVDDDDDVDSECSVSDEEDHHDYDYYVAVHCNGVDVDAEGKPALNDDYAKGQDFSDDDYLNAMDGAFSDFHNRDTSDAPLVTLTPGAILEASYTETKEGQLGDSSTAPTAANPGGSCLGYDFGFGRYNVFMLNEFNALGQGKPSTLTPEALRIEYNRMKEYIDMDAVCL